MKRKTMITLAVTALAVTACGSTTTTSTGLMSGTETLSASLSGKAAAADLNSNMPLTFPEGILSGMVTATIKPMTLGGGNGCTGQQAWVTSQGGLAVTHTSAKGIPCGADSNAPPPATRTENAATRTCHLVATFSRGTFAEIGGGLASTSWHGTYVVTATGYLPLDKGKKTCGFTTTGNVEASGASIVFQATGPMTR